MIEDELLSGIEEPDEHSAIARLIELGRQKSYVTIDDILSFFPEAGEVINIPFCYCYGIKFNNKPCNKAHKYLVTCPNSYSELTGTHYSH